MTLFRSSMIVNCGDYLSLLSRGRYKSPVHRVLCPPVDRVSYVFFYYPSYDARLDMSQWTPTSYEYNTLMDSDAAAALQQDAERSEEQTSELQSLMRISYAVFCLKK